MATVEDEVVIGQTHAGDDAEPVLVGFLVGVEALRAGKQAAMWITHDGVHLATRVFVASVSVPDAVPIADRYTRRSSAYARTLAVTSPAADELRRWPVAVYRFGDHDVDLKQYELRRAGVRQPVEPQVLDVLIHLIRHRDRLVTKEELLDTVWGDRFVSESALTSRIKAARRAIGDDGQRQGAIRTVRARGYRFVANVSEHAPEPAVSAVSGAAAGLHRDPGHRRGVEPIHHGRAAGAAVARRPGDLTGARRLRQHDPDHHGVGGGATR
jgi:DNA-binding winged helix-turn-helix (wHTH) protein